LPGRENVVVTRDPSKFEEVEGVVAIQDVLAFIDEVRSGQRETRGDVVWVIGGGQIYKDTADTWDGVELTLVKGEYEGDTHFPVFESDFVLVESQDFESFSFLSYRRKR
jgi:dihydrofolate reductase